jgi:hypothetical protein
MGSMYPYPHPLTRWVHDVAHLCTRGYKYNSIPIFLSSKTRRILLVGTVLVGPTCQPPKGGRYHYQTIDRDTPARGEDKEEATASMFLCGVSDTPVRRPPCARSCPHLRDGPHGSQTHRREVPSLPVWRPPSVGWGPGLADATTSLCGVSASPTRQPPYDGSDRTLCLLHLLCMTY